MERKSRTVDSSGLIVVSSLLVLEGVSNRNLTTILFPSGVHLDDTSSSKHGLISMSQAIRGSAVPHSHIHS